MSEATLTRPGSAMTPLRWVLGGGLVAGALDITYAITMTYFRAGKSPAWLLQTVASGFLGNAAFDGGMPTAALGLATHFFIALSAAFIFYAVATKVPLLTRHPWVSGPVYGIGIYLVMNFVVIPLSAFPFKPRYTAFPLITGLLVHMFFIGLPMALAARRALTSARRA